MRYISKMPRGHHPMQRQLERASRVTEEVRHAAQRLVLSRVEHMQDRADQQRMTGLLPVVALLQRPFGIDQDIGDVLHVAHLVRAAPHFQQRVVGRRTGIGRVEQQAVAKSTAPASGDLPVLALDVVDDGGCRPGQQRRHHQAHTLARARGRKGQDVFRPFVPQVVAVMLAEKDAGGLRQPGLANVGDIGPAGRAIGRHFARLARAPHRHGDGDHHGQQAAARRDHAAGVEHLRRVGVEEEPPLEQLPRVIDRRAVEVEPGRAQA